MRTTLDLNDRIMRRVKRKAMDEQTSIKAVINQSLKDALERDSSPPQKRRPYRCPAVSMGEPRINLDKALNLADDLEDEAILTKLEMRK